MTKMNRKYYWINENGSICKLAEQVIIKDRHLEVVDMKNKAWILNQDDVIIFAANDVESLYKHFYSEIKTPPLSMPYFSSQGKPLRHPDIYFYTFNVFKRKDKPLTKNMATYGENPNIYRQQVLQYMSSGAIVAALTKVTTWITGTYTVLLISARELSVPELTNLGNPKESLYFNDHVNPPQYLGFFPKTTDVGVRYQRIVEKLFQSPTGRDNIIGNAININFEHKLYSAGALGFSKNFD